MRMPVMGPRARWVLFFAVILAQLSVPAWMILARERVLAHGEIYRFRTAPVDPYDAFRGRYVALTFEDQRDSHPAFTGVEKGQWVYAELTRDDEGFAQITSVLPSPPLAGDFLRAKVRTVFAEKAFLDLPFDRYYLEEELAPAAERVYRQANGAEQPQAWAEVRVLRGRTVLEELYLDGKPIHEVLAGDF